MLNISKSIFHRIPEHFFLCRCVDYFYMTVDKFEIGSEDDFDENIPFAAELPFLSSAVVVAMAAEINIL